MTKENKNNLNSYVWVENKEIDNNNSGVIKDIQTWIEINTKEENEHLISNEVEKTIEENKEEKIKEIIVENREDEIRTNNNENYTNNNQKEYDNTFTLPLIGLIFFLGWYVSAWMWWILGIIIILALKWQDFDDERIVAIKEMINFFVSYLLWFFISAILCIVLIGFLMLIFFAIAWFIFSIVWLINHLNNKSYVYPLSIDIMNVRK